MDSFSPTSGTGYVQPCSSNTRQRKQHDRDASMAQMVLNAAASALSTRSWLSVRSPLWGSQSDQQAVPPALTSSETTLSGKTTAKGFWRTQASLSLLALYLITHCTLQLNWIHVFFVALYKFPNYCLCRMGGWWWVYTGDCVRVSWKLLNG